MARSFVDATPDYFRFGSIITAYPISVSIWFNCGAAANGCLFDIQDASQDLERLDITQLGDQAGDPIGIRTSTSGSTDGTDSSNGYTADAWNHAAGVWTNATTRAVFLNNTKTVASTTSITPTGIDRFSLAILDRPSQTSEYEGDLAECAIWDVALTDTEIAVLNLGYSPLFVRLRNLVFYFPMLREDIEVIGAASVTAFGSPGIAAHPPMIYPTMPYLVTAPAAVAAAPCMRTLMGVGCMTYPILNGQHPIARRPVLKWLAASTVLLAVPFRNSKRQTIDWKEAINGRNISFTLIASDGYRDNLATFNMTKNFDEPLSSEQLKIGRQIARRELERHLKIAA